MRNKEDQLQIAAVRWFKYSYPGIVIHHSKNGGSLRSAKEGAKFKAMGVYPGFADLFIMKATDDYHGLLIELKTDKGKQTDLQKGFELVALYEGYQYSVCRSIDEFMKCVNDYLT
jgi:hypothetical protein